MRVLVVYTLTMLDGFEINERYVHVHDFVLCCRC